MLKECRERFQSMIWLATKALSIYTPYYNDFCGPGELCPVVSHRDSNNNQSSYHRAILTFVS